MREIKFRAWHKDKYINLFLEDMNIRKDGMVVSVGYDNDGDGRFDRYEKTYPEVILEQYTGLKDKNGKDIYEGDIITDIHGDKRVVEFYEGGFWCFYPDESPYMPTEVVREVIGNIHENPQLR